MKMLHIADLAADHQRMLSPPMVAALRELGDLTILSDGRWMTENEISALIRDCDILLTGWGSVMTPDCIADDRGNLKYICNLTGTMRLYVKPRHIAAGIPVTNWGDSIAPSVAEGAVALLFAVLKNIRPLGKLVEAGFWSDGSQVRQTSLDRLRVGIYGMGAIGRKFVEYITPYNPVLSGYDPYVDAGFWPDSVRRVEGLDALFEDIDALVIHAGLSDETRNTVNAERLAKLPNHGVIINTARGGIIDQDALMAELRSGRLRAGIDVLDSPLYGDELSINDPARFYPNLTLTCHWVSGSSWPVREEVNEWQQAAIDNIKRFIAGEPLLYTMDLDRYERST